MSNTPAVNRKVLERYMAIEVLLANYGYFNRSTLEDLFGLSTPQVSNDIKGFMEAYPQQMSYDKSARLYRVLPSFQRNLS